MTDYGVMINGQLLIHKEQQTGDKPVVYTDEPLCGEDGITCFSFEERNGEIVQVWQIKQNPYGSAEVYPYTDPAEALSILLGGDGE